MDARLLEHAAEFCKLVAKADLLEYLGLTPQSNPEEVREALARRRRYMQGMQSNPKYATEARAFIKTFGDFQTLLQDPAAYASAAARRRESTHLPVLELTIRSALRGGPPSPEQIEFLRRNASELGVGDETFVDVLDRLSRDAGVSVRDLLEPPPPTSRPPARRLPSGPNPAETTERNALGSIDHYRMLGVARDATDATIVETYQQRAQAARERGDSVVLARLDTAFRVIGDPNLRRTYDLSRTTTGPPARDRDNTDPRAGAGPSSTAPPVRPRGLAPRRPDEPGRLGFTGAPIRAVRGKTPISVAIGVLGDPDDPSPPQLVADQPWVTIDTPPVGARREQPVNLRVDLPAVPERHGRAQLVLSNDRGEQAVLTLDAAYDAPSRTGWLAAFGGATVFLVGAATLISVLARPTAAPRLQLIVEPVADHVWMDGKDLGPGHSFVVAKPPKPVPLRVETSGFVTYEGKTPLEGPQRVLLEPTRPLDFVPGPDAQRGTVPDVEANRVMAPRREGINRCFSGQTDALHGTLRIYVDASGRPAGVTLEGGGAADPNVLACVRRESAAAVFPAVTGGDYATVRYDYSVNPGSP
jgi:hypothetical protein